MCENCMCITMVSSVCVNDTVEILY